MASLYPWPVEDVSTLSVRRARGQGTISFDVLWVLDFNLDTCAGQTRGVSSRLHPVQEQLEYLLPGWVKAVRGHRFMPDLQPVFLKINVIFMLKEQKVCFKRIKSKNVWTVLYIGLCIHHLLPAEQARPWYYSFLTQRMWNWEAFFQRSQEMHVLKIAGRHYINHWNFFSLYIRTLRGNGESKFTSFLVLKKNNIPSTWNTAFRACVWTCMSMLSSWPASSLLSSVWQKQNECGVWEKWPRWVSPRLGCCSALAGAGQ